MIFSEKFSDTDEAGAHLFIEHNQSAYDAEGRQVGLYIHGGSEFGTYSVDDIPRMIEVLQNIYDDFEANKPKTFVEQMEAAKIGSVITHSEGGVWMKHDDNLWVSYYGDRHRADTFKYDDDFEFVYEA